MQEAWRTYLELAMGVTEASRKKANKTVKQLIGKGGATAEQIRDLAGDLVTTSAANREALAKLVRFEVDRALGAVGLATAEEVAALTAKVQELERQLSEARAAGQLGLGPEPLPPAGAPVPAVPAAQPPAAPKAVAKKAAATKAVAKKAAAKKAVAKKADAAAKVAPAKGTTARKTAKRTPAKKATT